MTAPIAVVDCETTGLDPRRHDAWEIAVIRRDGRDGRGVEHLWQVRLDAAQLAAADPRALEIGRFHERRIHIPPGYAAVAHSQQTARWLTRAELRAELGAALDGAVLVGSNPAFDERFLRKFLGHAPWHYRPIDIATLAAGAVYATRQVGADAPRVPFSSRELSLAVGVEPPGDDEAHTALADCRWARDVYDAVVGGAR